MAPSRRPANCRNPLTAIALEGDTLTQQGKSLRAVLKWDF
jgi:hypothetical protein